MMNRYLAPLALAALSLAALPYPAAGQTVPDVSAPVESVIERQTEQARNHAERLQQQAEQAQQQTERLQQQAERAQQQAERVQEQAQRAQQQAERTQQQAERTLEQAERVQQRADRVQNRAEQAQQQLERSVNATEAIQRRVPGGLERLPEAADRQQESPILTTDEPGVREPAFVDLRLDPEIRIISSEWVMMLDAAQRQELEREAPDLMRFLEQTRRFEALDSDILTFRVPPDLDSEAAMRELVPETLQELLDRNHVYGVRQGPKPEDGQLLLPTPSICSDELSIGMIDSAVQWRHPAFSGPQQPSRRWVERSFNNSEADINMAHGTAIASLLLGEGPDMSPLLPNARLYNASVMYSQEAGYQGSSVVQLLEALDWLLAQPPRVINMSLAGPENRLLERGIAAALGRDRVIVAAVGNGGPHDAAQFPAAYEGVIAVTAVDRHHDIYRWANRGPHVDFAALGVDVPVALAAGDFGKQSGTSMAAPVVSAFMACALASEETTPAQALQKLRARAVDLGAPGHDPVFGHGLLHPHP